MALLDSKTDRQTNGGDTVVRTAEGGRQRMKLTLEIDEQRINEAVIKTMTDETVEQLENGIFGEGRYSMLKKLYKENVQAEVRTLIKAHEDEIVKNAISEAAAILARKVWKMKADEICAGPEELEGDGE